MERSDDDRLAMLREWSRPPRREVADVDHDALVREGLAALAAAVSKCASEQTGTGRQVVLLSGGLDSRAILASVLREFQTTEIVAATFGQPGEGDFDAAARVARAAGVEHVALETFSVDWSTDALVESILARSIPLPYPFGQRYLSYVMYRTLGSERNFWDGLVGDTSSGQCLPNRSLTWDEAIDHWLREAAPGWKQLVGVEQDGDTASESPAPDYDPRAILPDRPLLPEELLPYVDQLMFADDEIDYFATRIMRGYSVSTPFLKGPWLDFMFSIPLEVRYQQRMYLDILRTLDPRLFSLPQAGFGGASLVESTWRRRRRLGPARVRRRLVRAGLVSPAPRRPEGANDAIRDSMYRPGPIRDMFVENLADLAARDVVPWLDVESFAHDSHEPGGGNQAANRLLGLELNLKANDRLVATSATDREPGR